MLLNVLAEPGEPQPGVSCYHQCTFWAVPGNHTLWATDPKRGINYHLTLNVQPNQNALSVSSGNPGLRRAGLIAGIAGPLLMVGGIAVLFAQILSDPNYQCNESNCPPGKSYPLGPVMFFTGLIATPVGWALFATNGPRVNELNAEAVPASAPRDPRLKLGVVSLPHGGWGVGLSTLF